jgi:hypothetical protein
MNTKAKEWNETWKRRQRQKVEEEFQQRKLARKKALKNLELIKEREDRARRLEDRRKSQEREILRKQIKESKDLKEASLRERKSRSISFVDEESWKRKSFSSDETDRTQVEGDVTDQSLEVLEDFVLSEPGTSNSSTSGSLGQSNGDTSDESLSCRAIIEGDSSESFKTAAEQPESNLTDSIFDSDTFITGRMFKTDSLQESDTYISEQIASEGSRADVLSERQVLTTEIKNSIPMSNRPPSASAEEEESRSVTSLTDVSDIASEPEEDQILRRSLRRQIDRSWANGREFELCSFSVDVISEEGSVRSFTGSSPPNGDISTPEDSRKRLPHSTGSSRTSSGDRSSSSSLSSVLEANESRRLLETGSRKVSFMIRGTLNGW